MRLAKYAILSLELQKGDKPILNFKSPLWTKTLKQVRIMGITTTFIYNPISDNMDIVTDELLVTTGYYIENRKSI